MPINLVFVHGWSVTNVDTYGELPLRLRAELAGHGADTAIHEIWLGQYISFHDEVQLSDISRAFQSALEDQLPNLTSGAGGERFVCITHSTGGPVVRDWWARFWKSNARPCPMSHLIMLAPANFGSALAKLGKGTISRLKSWTAGVQPGQGVLDWLQLGSEGSWALNTDWIMSSRPAGGTPAASTGTNPPAGIPAPGTGTNTPAGGTPPASPPGTPGATPFYPFAIIGQSIDRHFYDNLNSYTGELGSDGVVRSAAANLNAHLIIVRQNSTPAADGTPQDAAPTIEYHSAPETPFLIVKGKSHSGDSMGIMKSVQAAMTDSSSRETVNAIISCIRVTNNADYALLTAAFAAQTDANQQAERLESVSDAFVTLTRRHFIHDRFCMVIFRVTDTEGNPVEDYDLLFTAGDNSPNHLPEGFFADRQQNSLHPETLTYFVNYDIMKGCPPVTDGSKTVRDAAPGINRLGLRLTPRPDDGFVRYRPLEIVAEPEFFSRVVRPNSTILIDIRLERMVSKQVFRLRAPAATMPDNQSGDFAGTQPDDQFVC